MKTFCDSANRIWSLALTIAAAKRVKQVLDVDLLAPEVGSPPLVTRMQMDVVLLIDVIFVCLQPQAQAAGVTDEQFGESIAGDQAFAAYEAFMEEWADFFRRFHRPDQATVVAKHMALIRSQVTKAAAAIERTLEVGETKLDRIRADAMERMERMADGNGLTSTSSPAS